MQLNVRSAPNFRDFGGLPTRDRRRIRRGWLYRSDALDTLEDSDHAALNPLGVSVICDLRSARERRESPSRLPPQWTPEILTVDDNIDVGAADVARAFRREMYADASRARDFMVETYQAFPGQFETTLRELFRRLAAGAGPVLVHCAAGKDRTGFVCSMVHHALGAVPDEVMADYLLSDRYFGPERIAEVVHKRLGLTPPPQMMDPMRVKPEYLNATFASIESEYGSIDEYLQLRAGLTDDVRAALRERLLEQPTD